MLLARLPTSPAPSPSDSSATAVALSGRAALPQLARPCASTVCRSTTAAAPLHVEAAEPSARPHSQAGRAHRSAQQQPGRRRPPKASGVSPTALLELSSGSARARTRRCTRRTPPGGTGSAAVRGRRGCARVGYPAQPAAAASWRGGATHWATPSARPSHAGCAPHACRGSAAVGGRWGGAVRLRRRAGAARHPGLARHGRRAALRRCGHGACRIFPK